MSQIIASAAIRGAHKIVAEAEEDAVDHDVVIKKRYRANGAWLIPRVKASITIEEFAAGDRRTGNKWRLPFDTQKKDYPEFQVLLNLDKDLLLDEDKSPSVIADEICHMAVKASCCQHVVHRKPL